MKSMDVLAALQELVLAPGPVGQEERVREVLSGLVGRIEIEEERVSVDRKGNLTVSSGVEGSRVAVMAHLDEIGMMVRRVREDGTLEVGPLGGTRVWKIGEGPVLVMGKEDVPGVLGFGSVHTTDPRATAVQAEAGKLDWSGARVLTGFSREELVERGVRPGTRVVIHPSRRELFSFGELVGGYFLDDRADLAAWLLALEGGAGESADFVATVSEEVGGEGALYWLKERSVEVCIALELGPVVPDADVVLSPVPTVWVSDSYATSAAADLELVASVGRSLGMDLQFQALSRGGSDASIAQSLGRCARGITLGIPMENTHGYEVIHREGISELGRLVGALVRELG